MADKMTLVEINAAIKDLDEKIQDLEDERQLLLFKLSRLQDKCPHPKGYRYNDRSGEGCFTCPDCGYDR